MESLPRIEVSRRWKWQNGSSLNGGFHRASSLRVNHTGRREIGDCRASWQSVEIGRLPSFPIYVNSFIYYLIYYILNTWKGWFKAVIFWNQHCDMLWSRESDVVADRQDDLLCLWRSTNSIDRSGTEQEVGFGFWGGSTIRVNSWKGEGSETTTQTSQHICCQWRWRDSRSELQIFFLVFRYDSMKSRRIP